MSEAKPLSFAAIAERKTEKPTLRCVRLDGHVVLKIAKHCRECMPNLVTGQLLGLDVGQTLEVTECFPFPVRHVPLLYNIWCIHSEAVTVETSYDVGCQQSFRRHGCFTLLQGSPANLFPAQYLFWNSRYGRIDLLHCLSGLHLL